MLIPLSTETKLVIELAKEKMSEVAKSANKSIATDTYICGFQQCHKLWLKTLDQIASGNLSFHLLREELAS